LSKSELYHDEEIFQLKKCVISEGHYTTNEDFINKLNYSIPLEERHQKIVFSLDSQNRGLILVDISPGYLIIFPRELRVHKFLGFKNTYLSSGVHEAEFPLILSNLTHFYVAADCVAPVFHGNQFVNIISTIPIRTSVRNANCEYYFQQIQYFPVVSEYISNIKIQIFNADLESAIFQSGNCYIKLHFRKSSLSA
jgi:hypothetical protein